MNPLHFTGPAATAVWSLLHDERCALAGVARCLPAHFGSSGVTDGLAVVKPERALSDGQEAVWLSLKALRSLVHNLNDPHVDAPNRAAFADTVAELLGVREVAA